MRRGRAFDVFGGMVLLVAGAAPLVLHAWSELEFWRMHFEPVTGDLYVHDMGRRFELLPGVSVEPWVMWVSAVAWFVLFAAPGMRLLSTAGPPPEPFPTGGDAEA